MSALLKTRISRPSSITNKFGWTLSMMNTLPPMVLPAPMAVSMNSRRTIGSRPLVGSSSTSSSGSGQIASMSACSTLRATVGTCGLRVATIRSKWFCRSFDSWNCFCSLTKNWPRVSIRVQKSGLLEQRGWCCYASKRFMLWTPTKSFRRNVAGLMPHPERACEPLLGSDDGKWIFESIFAALKNKTVAQAA